MTEEEKEKWAQALESDEYVQGRGSLRIKTPNVTRHCCLGVAAEIFGCRVIGEQLDGSDDRTLAEFEFVDPDNGDDIASVAEPPEGWMGLTHEQICNFICLNDKDRVSFKEIAAEVRKLPTT